MGRKAGLLGGGAGCQIRMGGIKGVGSQGGGGQRRQAGGLKGCNGSTATAVRSRGLLLPGVAVKRAVASFEVLEYN